MFFNNFKTYNVEQTLHYLKDNNILCNKQFSFKAGHSNEHALLKLIGQIGDLFQNKIYFLGIFMSLLKAFNTVGHKFPLRKKKLQYYHCGIKRKNLPWIKVV